MGAPTFDLQSHSIHSDGALTPREVVAAAAAAGVELLALTDHDTVDGVREASEAAAELGIRNVPAVEISAIDDDHGDLHILAYLIDPSDPVLREALTNYRADRERRAAAMIAALRELGFELELERLTARAAEGKSIGRPHLAQAVVAHPANAARLVAESRTEPSAFLEAYLIEGRPAFRARQAPHRGRGDRSDPSGRRRGGVGASVLGLSVPAEVLTAVGRFREQRIDGVECFYVTHTREQTELVVRSLRASWGC